MPHYSNPLDNHTPYRFGLSPKAEINTLIMDIKNDLDRNNNTQTCMYHLNEIICNLIFLEGQKTRYCISFSRDKNSYTKNPYKGRRFKLPKFLETISLLEKGEYIKVKNGFRDTRPNGQSRKSRLIPLDKFKIKLSRYEKPLSHIEEHPSKIIILRDSNKVDIPYKETRNTDRIHKKLTRINDLISASNIQCTPANEEIPFNFNILKRIFSNGSFYQGGRFYGAWWLNIKKETRKTITINGDTTIEMDFKAMHLDLLYSKEGLPLKEDPYTLEGISRRHRSGIKMLLNAMINAESNQIDCDKNGNNSIRNKLPKDIEIKTIKDLLKRKHSPIAKFFHSGKGVKLQFIDSCIAEGILLSLEKQKIPCLPVHDSFIIAKKNKNLLKNTMIEQFQKIVGRRPFGIE